MIGAVVFALAMLVWFEWEQHQKKKRAQHQPRR